MEAEMLYIIDQQLCQVGWEADTENLCFFNGTRPTKGRNLAIAEWFTDSIVRNHGRADYARFIGLQFVGICGYYWSKSGTQRHSFHDWLSGQRLFPLPSASLDEQIEIVRILDDFFAKEQRASEAVEGVLEQINFIKKPSSRALSVANWALTILVRWVQSNC